MDLLGNLLSNQRFNEPPEVGYIKTYVKEHYGSACTITVHDQEIVIAVPNAALAGALRMELPKIQKYANTTKPLKLRIEP